MNNIILFITLLIVIVIIFIITSLKKTKKNNNHFLSTPCKKGICYNNLQKCYDPSGYIYVEGSSDDKKIERKTCKCILNLSDKYKLLQLTNIFVPSIMDGTYCDVIYTTYYDYADFTFLKNRIYHLNMPLSKCIRIRSYHFNPNIYFEIKYPGGIKIRALIDKKLNLLEPESINEEYKETMVSIIQKIKQDKINPIFYNTYKRMSFIYKNNPSMRITIDTNIEYFYNRIYNKMDNDILEIKIPNSVSIGEAQEYLKEINNLANTALKYIHFSKFEYYYYQVLMNKRYG
jgi:hypothetical protein